MQIRTLITAVVFVVLAPVFAISQTTYSNLDDVALYGDWQHPPCIGPACAGGSATATSTSQTNGIASPSVDGASMEISMTCNSTCQSGLTAGETVNVLWPYKMGANNSLTTFTGSYQIYLPSVTDIQALEYDIFQFTGTRYMFGSECDNPAYTAGKWRIWNSAAGTWESTTVACTLFASPNVWHTIQWQVHRVSGDTSCGGDPCLHYDLLTVDGVSNGPFTSYPATTSSDPAAFGIQFQIDARYNSTTTVEYLDEVNFTVSNGAPTDYTLTVSGGTGGTVTDNYSQLTCPSTCSANYASGTSVTLTVSTIPGYRFVGWSGGGCVGTSTCTVSMTSALATTAVFAPTNGSGGMTLTGGAITGGAGVTPP